jgi:hypothetical protein
VGVSCAAVRNVLPENEAALKLNSPDRYSRLVIDEVSVCVMDSRVVKADGVLRVPLNDAHCIKKAQERISLVWIGLFELDCLA